MSISFSERTARNNAGATLSQTSPGMKMLLAEDPRFEWKKIREDRADSDMQLILRTSEENPSPTLTMDEARQILDACESIDAEPKFRSRLIKDLKQKHTFAIAGKVPVSECPAEGNRLPAMDKHQQFYELRFTPDYLPDRVLTPVVLQNFSIETSAATYRDIIAPLRKDLAIHM